MVKYQAFGGSRMRRATIRLIAFLTSLLVIVASAGAGAAEAFRIETKSSSATRKTKRSKPVSKTTTLFKDGIVYDFLESPSRRPSFASRTAASRAVLFC